MTPRHITPTPLARLAAVLAIVLAATACGTADPSATPTPVPTIEVPGTADPGPTLVATAEPTDPAADDSDTALYEEIEAQVSALRGIEATKPVEREVVDVAGVRDYYTKRLDEGTPPELLAASEKLYKSLLLIPQDLSLRDLLIELVESQALGVYDEKQKKMYVVSRTGSLGPLEKSAYAHEFVHALQDQRYDILKLRGDAVDQGDLMAARMTLIEGDAYLALALWQQANLTPTEMVALLGAVDPSTEAAMARLPEIVRQTLMFPATNGISLAMREFGAGGFDAIERLYANPPDTTEQVLHPDKLAADEQAVPVSFPADLAERLGSGWKVPFQDTLGEFQVEILLRDAGGVDPSESGNAAAGWGGDRVALIEGPGGEVAVVLDTAWDTAADADEFTDAVDQTMNKLVAAGRSAGVFRPSAERVILVSAADADTFGRLANVLGLAG